ncbi:MAG: hypothetical protein IKH06_01880 [Clostridiales bacterium]|nr:hypothetical protein [Clostridiales bacterium]
MTVWLISANSNTYNHVAAFNKWGYIDWKQSANYQINDIIYIYAKMISDSSKSSVVYVFPQDEEYQYDYFHSSYRKSMRIKDLITSEVYPHEYTACFPVNESYKNVVFEPTKTTLEKLEYASAFRFDNVFEEVITKSDSSNKIIERDKIENEERAKQINLNISEHVAASFTKESKFLLCDYQELE